MALLEKVLLVIRIPFLQSLIIILPKKLWTSGLSVNSHLSSSFGVSPSKSFWIQLINTFSLFNEDLKLVKPLFPLGSSVISLNPNISR